MTLDPDYMAFIKRLEAIENGEVEEIDLPQEEHEECT
jgi:hypothetical protein